ncbi:MAG TPA: hypothetical protein VEU96_05285 [Bryobacteraceae bacterium]|nr:hypothetical protein [Bryobacteraceae bacterium]
MKQFAIIILWIAVLTGSAHAGRRFSDYPASELYKGPVASVRFREKSDRRFQALIQDAIKAGPNFAGQYRLVRFQTGNGPIKVVLVDMKSGLVFHLPSDVVQDGLYIYDAPCLELYKKWQKILSQEDDDYLPLSYSPTSELLVVRRCIHSWAEESYLRWHNQKWTLIERVSLAPVPPVPVE